MTIGAAVASLAGCTSSSESSFEPPGTTQRPMTSGAYARSLLYVADGSTQVFTYPRGKPIGYLGVGGYICSDRFGNIFVTGAEGISYLWVFPHGGGQPMATLDNPQGPGECSVNGTNEDLAVANPDSLSGSIVVFPYNRKR